MRFAVSFLTQSTLLFAVILTIIDVGVYEAAQREEIVNAGIIDIRNVLIDKEQGGILIDWDHGRRAGLQSVQISRTVKFGRMDVISH